MLPRSTRPVRDLANPGKMRVGHKLSCFNVIALACLWTAASCVRTETCDVLVIGGSTSGTSAAVSAARMGAKVIVMESSPMLGGMLTAQGVSATDGNYNLKGGIWGEFRDSLVARYGSSDALRTGWVSEIQFEPHVGDEIFKNMLAQAGDADVRYGFYVSSAIMDRRIVKGAEFRNISGKRLKVKAKVTIDATDLGDFLPLSGTPYRIGMDSKAETGEEAAYDEADSTIQDLTLVGILKDFGPDADKTIAKPEGYDPAEFAGCCHTVYVGGMSAQTMLDYGRLPGGKFMLNWPGSFGNDIYLACADQPFEQREESLKAARAKTQRFIYFIQTELSCKNLGIADDEFRTEDGLAYQAYFREGRRMRGAITMTLDDIENRYRNFRYRTGISVGDYPVDHHHKQNPDARPLTFPKVPSFCVSAGVMLPVSTEGLIVSDKAISVTNLANGSTRLQPVVLGTGQAAGTLAALAVISGKTPKEVQVRELQQALLDQGCYLQPTFDVSPDDPDFQTIQRIASTGIFKMTGEPWHWENRSWFHADSTVSLTELREGLASFYTNASALAKADSAVTSIFIEGMTRREAANAIDSVLDPFAVPVDLEGIPAFERP